MKKFLFMFIILISTRNINSAELDNRSIWAKLIHNLAIDKDLLKAIAKLNVYMSWISQRDIKYEGSTFLTWGGKYQEICHYSGKTSNVKQYVDNYQEALNNFRSTNAFCSIGDGAILGCLIFVISKISKSDIKKSGISLILLSILITITKSRNISQTPYLNFPQLKLNDNYFTLSTHLINLLLTVGAGAASYFSADFLINRLNEKISAIRESVK